MQRCRLPAIDEAPSRRTDHPYRLGPRCVLQSCDFAAWLGLVTTQYRKSPDTISSHGAKDALQVTPAKPYSMSAGLQIRTVSVTFAAAQRYDHVPAIMPRYAHVVPSSCVSAFSLRAPRAQ